VQGDVSLAFVRSKTGDYAPQSDSLGTCPDLGAAVDNLLPVGLRSGGDTSGTSNPLSLLSSVISGARGRRAGARAAADAAASTAYYSGQADLNFGLAVVFSGVTTVVNAKDDDIKHGGFFEVRTTERAACLAPARVPLRCRRLTLHSCCPARLLTRVLTAPPRLPVEPCLLLLQYTPFFNALNATEAAALATGTFVVPSASSAPVVTPGDLELAFFA
jgi:hypothetical protein